MGLIKTLPGIFCVTILAAIGTPQVGKTDPVPPSGSSCPNCSTGSLGSRLHSFQLSDRCYSNRRCITSDLANYGYTPSSWGLMAIPYPSPPPKITSPAVMPPSKESDKDRKDEKDDPDAMKSDSKPKDNKDGPKDGPKDDPLPDTSIPKKKPIKDGPKDDPLTDDGVPPKPSKEKLKSNPAPDNP